MLISAHLVVIGTCFLRPQRISSWRIRAGATPELVPEPDADVRLLITKNTRCVSRLERQLRIKAQHVYLDLDRFWKKPRKYSSYSSSQAYFDLGVFLLRFLLLLRCAPELWDSSSPYCWRRRSRSMSAISASTVWRSDGLELMVRHLR